MSLQFIMNNNTQTCETDAFLDSLVAMEHVDHDGYERMPSSPVFYAPREPLADAYAGAPLPDPFTIYNYYHTFIWYHYGLRMEFPGKTEYTTYRSSKQMKFKNQNKNSIVSNHNWN